MLAYFKWLIRYMAPYKFLALLLLLFSLITAGFDAGLRLSFKFFIEASENIANSNFFFMGWLFILATIIYLIIGFMADWVWAKFSVLVINNIRQNLFDHITFLSLDFFARRQTGDILNCFAADLALLEESLVSTIYSGLISLTHLLIHCFLLFYLDANLAIVGFSGLLVIFIFSFWLIGKAAKYSYLLKQKEGLFVSYIQDKIINISVIKSFGLEQKISADFSTQLNNIIKIALPTKYLRFLTCRLPKLSCIMTQIITILVGGIWILQGKLLISTFVAFQILFMALQEDIYTLSWVLPYLVNETAVMQRLNLILTEVPTVIDPAQAIVLKPFSGRIDLQNITFGYALDQSILHKVSLSFHKGQFTTIVGESGSGKSTIIKLLVRFYDPDQGAVLFDGIDLRNTNQNSLRSQISVVSQNVMLLNTTIAENIRFGNLNATDDEIILAAKDAEIHDFIMSLPQKYDTMAGEQGARLSGGQGQRIALARALVRRPAILILDEATSALDATTEDSILQTIGNIAQNYTVISITHRITQAQKSDMIHVLKDGILQESGSHAELIALDKVYANLWKHDHKQEKHYILPQRGKIVTQPYQLLWKLEAKINKHRNS